MQYIMNNENAAYDGEILVYLAFVIC